MDKASMLTMLTNAVEQAVTLEIRTVVGTITVDANGKCQPAEGAKVLCSTVNLLQGDITTAIDPAFVSGEYQSLMSYHAEREKEATAILNANLEAIGKLFALVKEHFQ